MKRSALLLLLFFAIFSSQAQNSHLYFDKLDTKKGLPESSVRIIKEDSEGYIWFSTQNGLVRYDGYNYKVYHLGSPKLNKHAIDIIMGIAEAPDKNLWISTYANGLFRYDRSTDSFVQFAYPGKALMQSVYDIVADKSGAIWGAMTDTAASIIRFSPSTKRYDVYPTNGKTRNSISASQVIDLYKDNNGIVWIATDNGLYTYSGPGSPLEGYVTSADTSRRYAVDPVYHSVVQPNVMWINHYKTGTSNASLAALDLASGKVVKVFKQSPAPDSLHNTLINGYYEDKAGNLWLATKNAVAMLDLRKNKFNTYPLPDTGFSFLSDIKVDKYGKFWLNAVGGLVKFDPVSGKYELLKVDANQPGSLTSAYPNNKIFDHTGTLWLGYTKGGVNKLNRIRSAFEVVKPANNKQLNNYGGVVISSTKELTYFYTARGIFSWQTNTGQFKPVLFLPDVYVTEVAQDGDTFYLATGDGLLIYNNSTGKKQYLRYKKDDPSTISGNTVERVYRDHTGLIWMGAYRSGVCTYDPRTGKITRYPYQSGITRATALNDGSLDDSRAISFYEDMQNTLWVGTNNGSLNKYDRATGKFTSYRTRENMAMTCVDQMYEDHSGRFWVGTYQNGLFEFDRKKGRYTRHYTENNGLLYNSIISLREDSLGRIWISSDRGLTRLDPKLNHIQNFKADDILPGEDLADLSRVSLYDGRFVVAIKGGFAIFNPTDLDDDPNPPVVHLETVKYNSPGAKDSLAKTVVTFGMKKLELSHDQNSLQFNFIGLHYENPEANTYAYMLEGFDKQWVYAGTNRIANYSNLPAGTYTFKVKAANSSGVWNEQGDSVIIVISPPWWFTWWAWLLWVILFIAAIYWYVRYRSEHLKYENQLLEERVEERTNQLSEANRELSEQQEEITAQRDQLANTVNELKATQQQLIQSEKLASLGELTAGIAHEIQNPLNFVNNFSEVSMELATEMKEELRSGSKKEALAIASDIELNLEKIVHHGKRADAIVKNMLQHSRANTGEKQPTDINALADEYLRLSYHGLRAKDKNFNAEMLTDFDPELPKINVVSQDIGRVLLNLFNNAFYAVQQKQKAGDKKYKPVIEVSTRLFTPPAGKSEVRIYVKDNGTGIPEAVKDKILQPFFTTKPTGEGTGLGLSLSYDIVSKGHGGKIEMESKEGEYTEFIVKLPVK